KVSFPNEQTSLTSIPTLKSVKSGLFSDQVPDNAVAVAQGLNSEQLVNIKQFLHSRPVEYRITQIADNHIISVKGNSSSAAQPHLGDNALSYLAVALNNINWQTNDNSLAIRYIAELAGESYLANQFGDIAYQDDFMGPLTLSPTLLTRTRSGALQSVFDLRIPKGKSRQHLTGSIQQTLSRWQAKHQVVLNIEQVALSKPYFIENAPQLTSLLAIYDKFSGNENSQPVSIGYQTIARSLPNAVGFGPAIPGHQLSSYSSNEHITVPNFQLLLKTYSAMMIEFAGVR
ncbi:MAG: hypothetical protein V2I33_10545, partial [Kangiellaceae bacterium]|nr:hypothetical protein [Kangiellaceae bacterium]